MVSGCVSGGSSAEQPAESRKPTPQSVAPAPAENRASANNRTLAALIVAMGPPTVISLNSTGRPINSAWDPAGSEGPDLDQLKSLLEQGADPNALRISGYYPRMGWDRTSEGANSSFAVAGSKGKLVGPGEEGDSLLDFCRKYKLTRAATLLQEHGAK